MARGRADSAGHDDRQRRRLVTEHIGPRISVIGCSGTGKSWTASRLAEALGLPHIELDAIRHGPGWTETPDDEFRRRVSDVTSGEGWVVDGNYEDIVRDVIWTRATDVVWLDYERSVVMRQVIVRSFMRALFRTKLWNGNRERLRDFVRWYHPMRWAWSQHGRKRLRDGGMLEDERWSHLRVARLATRGDTDRLLQNTARARTNE
jgi:adenylate kinase family enzyme